MSNHLLDLTSEGLFVLDHQARITFANRAFREACGCALEGMALCELVGPVAREHLKNKLDGFMRAECRSLRLQVQLATTTNALELTLTRREHDNDKVYGRAHVVTHHELSASTDGQPSLFEHKLRALHESELFLIAVSEIDSARLLDVNRGFERIYNVRAEDVIGKTAVEIGLLSAEDQARHAATLQSLGKRNLNALELTAPDGRPIKLLMHSSKLGDCDPALTVSIAADVTDYIAAEERGKESDMRWRAVFETLNDAMFFADLHGRFFDVNTAACKQLGYTRDELLQMSVRDIAPKPNKNLPQVFDEFQGTSQVRFESTHRRKDGVLVPVELTLCKIPFQGGFAIAGIARDLTEQRRIEAEVREAHNRMQAILQTLPDLLFEIDQEGIIRDFYSARTDLLTMPTAHFL
ncbi:MAG TPA: PAS domain S-box protein, partial [Polyangiales bacterium]|nr:PAS domain S-box protein [Polyangiales bacterium]